MNRIDDLSFFVNRWLEQSRTSSREGKCADYIPALSRADPLHLGLCIMGADGTILKSGDAEIHFTMQSIAKVIGFMVACLSCGIPQVLEQVDVEPTGDAFNSILRLETNRSGRPFNPFINAGALTVTSILPGTTARSKLSSVVALAQKLVGKPLRINEEVFQSEWETAYRNRALSYYLKEVGYLKCDVEVALEVYLKQCAIEVTVAELARIGLILALDGYDPWQHEQVLPKEVSRLTKSLMLTCGMYNASGKFAAFVGVPAKSGVSGGIMAAVPMRAKSQTKFFDDGCGIGIYGPAIDEYGNSTAGAMLLKILSNEWDLNIF